VEWVREVPGVTGVFVAGIEFEIGDHDGDEEDDFDGHGCDEFASGERGRLVDEFDGVGGRLADILRVSADGQEQQDQQKDPDRDQDADGATRVDVMLDKHGAPQLLQIFA